MLQPVTSHPLSPLQEGMLFNSLIAPNSGVEIEQVICTLAEPLDLAVFRSAWEQVVARHDSLRTCFDWTLGSSPRQHVHERVAIAWHIEDMQHVAVAERTAALEDFLERDRRTDFTLEDAAMRLALLTFDSQTHHCIWTFHHAILDGRSFPIVLAEVFACYRALLANEAPHLPAAVPFSNFLSWHRQRSREHEPLYWRQTLRGFTAATPLPFATARTGATNRGLQPQIAREQRLTAELTSQLQSAADRMSVTMNTLLQGCWALLLSHYSGPQDGTRDIVFGVTRACRKTPVPAAESIVGLMINTIPLRVRWDEDATTTNYLQAIRQTVLELRTAEHASLADIQRWSEVPAGSPLFQTLVVFENQTLHDRMRAMGSDWKSRSFEYRGQTNFPLALIAYGGSELLLRLEADPQRFSTDTLDKMLGHLQQLLSQMAQHPDALVESLPYVSPAEIAELRELAQLSVGSPVTNTLHQWFEAHARENPQRIALTFENEAISYGELNRRANRLAHHLRNLGVGPDGLVGIATERCVNVLVGILAILKAGGAYVPIDLAYPAQRLAFILEDCRAPILLTQSSLIDQLPMTGAKVVCIDDESLYASSPETNPNCLNSPSDLAYVIYTSGSTGNPKGALVTHANVVRLFTATHDWFQFNEHDVWTLFHSYAFDFSVWEIWGALLFGGRLVIVPYLTSRSPDEFLSLLSRERVTVLNQTPSAFRQLIQADQAYVQPLPLNLRYVVFGGEALEMQSLKPWFDRRGDQLPQLINMYGITETTVHVSYRPLSAQDLQRGSVIGIPIPDLAIYVLDHYRNLVPVGVPGEMYVGGSGLARGYLHREELTAERFIAHPFSNYPGDRLYRTGDLARLLPGRDIEYLGRIDHQVKIRGFRIELGEIESKLCEHPDIRQAIVLAREDHPGEKRLVAYLVAESTEPSTQRLRDFLKLTLPEYMVPAAYVFLGKLPLTNNGKIDRAALPRPVDVRPDLIDSYVAPRNEIEQQLAGIWCDVLRMPRVGVFDNYFELGGDSIQSTLVVAAARKLGLQITPRQLFESPTIDQLAMVAVPTAAVSSPLQEPIVGVAPLTPIQHWFFEQQLAEAHHYNQAFLFQSANSLDENYLRAAMNAVERQHDSLRLCYHFRDERWLQEFTAPNSNAAPLHLVNLENFSDGTDHSEIERVAAETQSSLNIGNGPLWRVVLFRLLDGSCRLLIVVHHLAIDGVSWRILLEDLENAYLCAQRGEPLDLPAKTTSFREWGTQLLQYAESESLAIQRAHWSRVAAHAAARLPYDAFPAETESATEKSRTSHNNSEGAAASLTVSLTEQQTQDLLQRVPAAYNTMINDVLLTAFARALHRLTHQREFVINLEGHGREDLFAGIDLTRTLGWFTAIYPVHLQLPASDLLSESLKAIKEQLRSVPERGVGYGVMRYLTNSASSMLPAQLQESEIVFNYLGKFDDVVRNSKLFTFAAESCGPWHSPRQKRRHVLEINSMVVRDRLEIQWTFAPQLHRRETIENFANHFLSELSELITHCTSSPSQGYTPSDFPLCGLDQVSLDQLVAKLPDIEDIYPPSPIQLLFLARAASHPNAVIDQWHGTLRGPLDIEAFRRAWQDVFAQHPALRTSFCSEGLEEPLQIVHRKPTLPWSVVDWSVKPAVQHAELWQQLLREDQASGMALDQSPLSRISIVRLSSDEHRFLWTVPALLLDGWSWPLVFADLSQAYACQLRHEPAVLKRSGRYRDYLSWLRTQNPREDDSQAAEARRTSESCDLSPREFWQSNLTGFRTPTPLISETTAWASDTSPSNQQFERCTLNLSPQLVEALQRAIRSQRLTLGGLMQSAWALVLSRLSCQQDVVFGAAFSGRPTDLPGSETIVGPFVNNLPVRLQCDPTKDLRTWLLAVRDQLLELNRFQYVPLSQIQAWSDVPWHLRLFNSLVVVQNYVVEDAARQLGTDVSIERFSGPIHTNFPLLLLVEPVDQWQLSMIYDRRQLSRSAIERWLSDLVIVLEFVAREDHISLDRVLQSLSTPVAAESTSTQRRLFVASLNYVAPNTPTQKAVAQVWQEVIQLERISIEDNLFDLGVHSLLVVQLHKKLHERLKQPIGLLTLFRYPSIFALAQFLDSSHQVTDRLSQSQDRGERQRQKLASLKNIRSKGKR